MLRAAGLTLTGGTADDLATAEMNGRQIRNLTRLAKILHPSGAVSVDEMRDVMTHGTAAAGAERVGAGLMRLAQRTIRRRSGVHSLPTGQSRKSPSVL